MNGLYRLKANPKGVSKIFWTNVNTTRKTINDSKVRSAPIPPVATPQGSTFKDAADYAMFSVLIPAPNLLCPHFQVSTGNFQVPPASDFNLKISTIYYLHSAILVVMSSSDICTVHRRSTINICRRKEEAVEGTVLQIPPLTRYYKAAGAQKTQSNLATIPSK